MSGFPTERTVAEETAFRERLIRELKMIRTKWTNL